MSKNEIGRYIGIGLLMILLLLTIFCTVHYMKKCDVYEQNIKALNDSVHIERLKNKELLVYKESFVLDKKDIEKQLGISKEKIKELERKINDDVMYISKLENTIKHDTIIINGILDNNIEDGYLCAFNDSNEFYQISGITNIKDSMCNVVITNNITKLDLNVGITDNWKIFATTNNPYVNIDNINGAVLDKSLYLKREKKQRFSVGVNVGFGGQYGIIHRNFDVGPYVGIGISYNIINF